MWGATIAPRRLRYGAPSALRAGLFLTPGMRVGLYGGSFDPPHAGHAHVARIAMRRLGLDRVIWIVSPRNPLKGATTAATFQQRVASTARLAEGRSMLVSDFEGRIGARYTIDTLRAFRRRFPAVRFVWVMGADGLADFHRWRGWAQILREVPVAVVARPLGGLKSRFSPAARRFARARLPSSAARRLAFAKPPAWTYLDGRWNFTSSTRLRDKPSAGDPPAVP
jgi:nicotinate-nucleotide adenylyltransferase